MRGGAGVVAAGEHRGEPLVVGLDRDLDRGAQRLDERRRLARLVAVLAAQRQRQADDDRLGLLARGSPASSRSKPAGVPTRSTTPTGRATVPVGSETATPVRADP